MCPEVALGELAFDFFGWSKPWTILSSRGICTEEIWAAKMSVKMKLKEDEQQHFVGADKDIRGTDSKDRGHIVQDTTRRT